ncbi:AAA family ATPase [Halanaerobacter jeridensis]|uniref:ATP-dependent protease Clp ATPase subunit n=1 Tax=Halanaerobacter jeridensis TaxID=706427 RepID=A0A939BQ22_9FIRM|nr:AAA family ATPase [Halanaerobacter jeridensis]MBM7557782.1 ATP-dependent protease Clp ATPase subunit [Halanaerobacter jeridensis]
MGFFDRSSQPVDDIQERFLQRITNIKFKNVLQRLKNKIVGNEEKITKLLSTLYFHYKSYQMDKTNHDSTCILITGSTGSGKTYITQNVLEELEIPYVKISAASLSSSGYQGQSLNQTYLSLEQKVGSNLADIGVYWIDEMDKLQDFSKEGKVSKADVQDELLNWVEGSNYQIKRETESGKETFEINTTNNIFIFTGSFSGVEKNYSQLVGFAKKQSNNRNTLKKYDYKVTRELLKEQGVKEELLGRIGVILKINPIKSKEKLFDMVEKDDTLVNRYKSLLNKRDIQLTIQDSYKHRLPDQINFGFREIKNQIKSDLSDIFYKLEIEQENTQITQVCLTEQGVELKKKGEE